jgi:transposase
LICAVYLFEIASFLNITPMMVSRAIKRFEEAGSNQDRPKGRPEKTARNRRNIQRTKEMNQRNPTTKANSTRKLAKKLGIGRESARKLLREDLGLKPYKYLKRQKLTDIAKLKRLQRARAVF